MSARLIRLLHVEDDEIQRRLIRALLEKRTEYRFTITYASSEDSAVETFKAGFDCVILDYSLTHGNELT